MDRKTFANTLSQIRIIVTIERTQLSTIIFENIYLHCSAHESIEYCAKMLHQIMHQLFAIL